MEEAIIKAKLVNLTLEERSSIDPIVFDGLPSEEQELILIAIDDGTYRKCPAADPYIPDALSSFAHRTGEHTNENRTAYLKFNSDYYKLYVQVEDQIYAG